MFKKLHTTGRNKLSRILAGLISAVLLLGSFPAFSASADTAPFKDMEEGSWYYETVMGAVEKGLFNGMGDGTFCPDGNITRAQFAIALARLCGVDTAGMTGAPFADVPADSWFYSAISWAYNAGVVNGVSATEFKPNDNITRQEMSKMIALAMEQVVGKSLSAADAKTFEDQETIADWAEEWVAKCSANGIIEGHADNTFDPLGNATFTAAIPNLRICPKCRWAMVFRSAAFPLISMWRIVIIWPTPPISPYVRSPAIPASPRLRFR